MYAGYDTKGGFISGAGYSLTSLAAPFSPVSINTNLLSAGIDYSGNAGWSANAVGYSFSKQGGLVFNPSIGASLNFKWQDIYYDYLANGNEITDYENAIYKTQNDVNTLLKKHNINKKVYYRDENEKLSNGYKRGADGKLYNEKGKLLGGCVQRSQNGLSIKTTIHMSPYNSADAFAITLNHELIHIHHYHKFDYVRYTEGLDGFEQLSEYGAYSYTQLYNRRNIIPSEFVPSQSMLNRNIMHLSYPKNLIPIVSDRYGRVVY